MRRITIWIAGFLIAWGGGASQARAALEFRADFARDGVYENSWPMIAGEVVTVDIYVSNVPAPGLLTIGFKLAYDTSRLEVEGAALDFGNWPSGQEDPLNPTNTFVIVDHETGEVEMYGFRLGGLAGDNIHLGWVTFRCKETGSSDLILSPRGFPYSGFVLDTLQGEVVLDGDLGEGVVLATVRPPVIGDVNGDQNVDLADAILGLKAIIRIDSPIYIHVNADLSGDDAIGLPEIGYALRRAAGLP